MPLNTRLAGADYLQVLADSGSKLLVTTGAYLQPHPELSELSEVKIIRADGGNGSAVTWSLLLTRPPSNNQLRAAAASPRA